MEIIVGKFVSNHMSAFPGIIEPIKTINDFSYSGLYMFEEDKLGDSPFNLLYFVRLNWLKANKNDIFNYSYSNHPEFQEFIDDVGFPTPAKRINGITKERNYLITELNVSLENVYKVIMLRNFNGFSRINDLLKGCREVEDVNVLFGTSMSGIEYTLK